MFINFFAAISAIEEHFIGFVVVETTTAKELTD
jgi:hypothetical protein